MKKFKNVLILLIFTFVFLNSNNNCKYSNSIGIGIGIVEGVKVNQTTDIYGFPTTFQALSFDKTFKQTNILGADIELLTFDVELDRDYYTQFGVGCPNYTIPSNVGPFDCSCDYASHTKCGLPVTNNASCPAGCPSLYLNDSNTSYNYYCSGQNWTEIVPDKTYTYNITQPMNLRFKANMSLTSFTAYTFLGMHREGYYVMSASPDLRGVRRSTASDIYKSRTQFTICPSDNSLSISWTRNTYFITITPLTPYAWFDFTVYSGDVPTQNSPVSSPGQTPDGGIIFINGASPNATTEFNVYQNVTLTIRAPDLGREVNVYINDNPIYNQSGPTLFRWALSSKYKDSVTITTGPFNSTLNRTLSIYIVSPATVNLVNYVVYISSYSRVIRQKPSDLPLLGGTFAMGNGVRMRASIFSAPWFGMSMAVHPMVPRQEINPLWPLPNILTVTPTRLNLFKDIMYNETNNPFKPRSIQFSLVVDYKADYIRRFTAITAAPSRFIDLGMGTLVDIDGNPMDVFINTSNYIRDIPCNYTQFQTVVDSITDIQSSISSGSYRDVVNGQFQISMLLYSDAWAGCVGQTSKLSTVDYSNNTRVSSDCVFMFGSDEWNYDPCCNITLQQYQCCIPKPVLRSFAVATPASKDAVQQVCSSYECTAAVLSDYFKAVNDLAAGECDINVDQLLQYRQNITNLLKFNRATSYQQFRCTLDAECAGGRCNQLTGICDVPSSVIDHYYLFVVGSSAPPMSASLLKTTFGLAPNAPLNSTNVDFLLGKLSSPDCTSGYNYDYRTTYQFQTYDSAGQKCYPSPICIDGACELDHDVCIDGNVHGYQLVEYSTKTAATCANNTVCSAGGVLCTTGACQAACTGGYCAACLPGDASCSIVSQYTTAATCNNTSVCVSNNITVPSVGGVCTNGNCSHPCGLTCMGPPAMCILPSATSIAVCNQQLGTWNNDLGVCTFPAVTNQLACYTGNGAKWVDCSTMNPDECYQPYSPLAKNKNLCYVQPVPCQSAPECDSAMACGDTKYFLESYTGNPNYDDYLGRCVRPTYDMNALTRVSSCNMLTENDSPVGCYPTKPIYFSRSACEAVGNFWWTASTTLTDCWSNYACLANDYFSESSRGTSRINNLTQSECSNCTTANTIFRFEVSRPKWYPATLVPVQWTTKQLVRPGSIQTIFNPKMLADLLYSSYETRIADMLRSSALCRLERVKDNLKSLACACSGPGGSECFSSSSVLLGESKPCMGEVSAFEFSYGSVGYTGPSVPYYCASVLVSQVNRQIYRTPLVATLSSNFATYERHEYSVTNGRGAVIGELLTDGIKVQASGVQLYTICLGGVDVVTQSRFPVFDICQAVGANETYNGVLTPMDTQAYMIHDDTRGINLVCADISINTSSTATYFAMARDSSWKNSKYRAFDNVSTGLIYAMAVIFLACTVWGLVQLGYVAYRHYLSPVHEAFKLVHMLIFTVTLFIAIRAIYFFILPTGTLAKTTVSDYILVVLPTFVYFSAFTIITVLWYIIISAKARGSDYMRRIGMMIGMINVVLYVLFIVIVLVFHFSTQAVPLSQCGGRTIIGDATTNTPQRVVSIVYAVFQAVVSLIIGTAFIYLGYKIYTMMRGNSNQTEAQTETSRRIYIVTWASSVGFILHCAFVLVLVAAELSNMIFSFIGLTITEVIPALSILYAYNQLSTPANTNNTQSTTSPKLNKHDTTSSQSSSKLKKIRKNNPDSTSTSSNSVQSANNSTTLQISNLP